MKTDDQLKQDLMAELAWDPAVNATAIGVAVQNGVVTVSGHLDSYAQRWLVEKAVRRVKGVKAFALELDVKLAPEHKRTDTDIAEAAAHALQWQVMLPNNDLRVTVSNGHVTVEGEVKWDFQRKSVDHALRNLKGVTWLDNRITLKDRPALVGLRQRISEALNRQAAREANRIEIDVNGGTVILRGTVHSWHEREASQGAVWGAPGVRRVVNELKIA